MVDVGTEQSTAPSLTRLKSVARASQGHLPFHPYLLTLFVLTLFVRATIG